MMTHPLHDARQRWAAFADLGALIHRVTGARLVGSDGGDYVHTSDVIAVPDGDVEAAVHELCHFIVASQEERRMPNLGLSTDWTHPRFDRMVRCEEMAWSLELWLFGDPTPGLMRACMTPESVAAGGGGYTTAELNRENVNLAKRGPCAKCGCSEHRHSDKVPGGMLSVVREWNRERGYPEPAAGDEGFCRTAFCGCVGFQPIGPTEAARAEVAVARATALGTSELRPDGSEALRREALQKAEALQLPVKELRDLIARAYPIGRQRQAATLLQTRLDDLLATLDEES